MLASLAKRECGLFSGFARKQTTFPFCERSLFTFRKPSGERD
ncbi:MAG: hypothetical protein U5L45_10170 [Saprospiraceae bacterium]|nr:hypothetical protein [Saprospiraceae bacterium]